MRDSTVSRLIQAGFVAAVLLIWVLVTGTGLVNPIFVPHPVDVVKQLGRLIVDGSLWDDLKITLFELALAFTAAAVSGTLIGFAVSTSRWSTRVFEPLFAAFFAIPIIVFYPLTVLYFGLGPESKIVHGGMFGFFPIALNTISGFASVDRRLLQLADAMGASPKQRFVRILFPAALPIMITGYRMGFILTFLSIIGSESIASLAGLGHRIVWYAEALETPKMFAYIVIVVVLAMLLNAIVAALEVRRRGNS